MTEWHELLLLTEDEFDALKPIGLRAFPVYYCIRANGQIEVWPNMLWADVTKIAWGMRG